MIMRKAESGRPRAAGCSGKDAYSGQRGWELGLNPVYADRRRCPEANGCAGLAGVRA